MLKNQCISVTDLRQNTSKYLSSLKQSEKYVFINNKPVAVLLDIDKYESERKIDLIELEWKDINYELQKLANETWEMESEDFINI